MSTPAEDALYAALTEIDDLERLARMGLSPEAIPTEAMRPVVAWALTYYFNSGRTTAPTREMLLADWRDVIEDAGIELIPESQERDTIDSAVENLKGRYAEREFQIFIKEAATKMATAPITEKVATLSEVTNDLFGVTNGLQDRTDLVEADAGFSDSLRLYKERAESDHTLIGIATGWGPVDEWTGGFRPGELAILAAGPKVGKSYCLAIWALREFLSGRRTVLFTLENSVEMTYNRLVCILAGVSARAYQRGTLSIDDAERVEKMITEVRADMDRSLHVISPPRGGRTPEMMVRQALMMGAESILVDQLTHVEHPDPGRKARHELFNENVHEFKYLISTGREQVPLVLAHQINREGVKAADKVGHLEMHHLAESAGVERAADWIFGMYQSQADREARMTLFQILAARREDTKAWSLYWDMESGGNRVRNEVTID